MTDPRGAERPSFLLTFCRTLQQHQQSVVRMAVGAGLVLSVAACGSMPVPTYNLSAPGDFSAGGRGRGQLVVAMPSALAVLNTDKIVVEPGGGQVAYLGNAQWVDQLPPLLQARIIQSFENGSNLRRVARPGDGVTADYQLLTDIRAFGLHMTEEGPRAVVEVSAKVVNNRSGAITAAKVFKASVPAASTSGEAVTQALDTASDEVLVSLVSWAARYF
ncbi:ABC-type transport auxiliary lipoprotein family protein [Xanthobacter sp. TB0139]|uniref:ABC-type transport auxiliary lipoprotein family protein n=1 Tax=Xanthobacter sp. TB0139 TaxID=3459178 RepID=UPI004039D837